MSRAVLDCRNEYVFKRLVDYINALNREGRGPKITTSMARELRAMVQQSLISDELNGPNAQRYSLTDPDGRPKSREEQDAANAAVAGLRLFEDASGLKLATSTLMALRKADGQSVKGVKGINELMAAWTEPYERNGKQMRRIGRDVRAVLERIGQEFDEMYARGVVPVSPYGPDTAYRDAFMDAGVDCLYFNRDQLEQRDQVYAANNARMSIATELSDNRQLLQLYARPDDARAGDAERAMRNAVTASDRSGFTRLRPYLSAEDYEAVSKVIAAASGRDAWDMRQSVYVRDKMRIDLGSENEQRRVGRNVNFRDARIAAQNARVAAIRRGTPREQIRGGMVMLERAEAILRKLREDGIPFTVRTNAYDGQVMLDFDNGMELRLVDTKDPGYSGTRMYQGGRTMLLKVDRSAYAPELQYSLLTATPLGTAYTVDSSDMNKRFRNSNYVPHCDASPEECVAFVEFCFGHPVNTLGANPRPAGQVGPVEHYSEGRGRERRLFKSEHTEDHFYADMGRTTTAEGASYALCVDVDSTGRAGTDITRHVDGRAAREWLKDKIDSAKVNFSEAVGLDDMFERASVARALASSESSEHIGPAFSVDEDIAFIQRQYWDVLSGAEETLVRPGHDFETDEGDVLSDATYPVFTDTSSGSPRHYVEFDGQRFPMDMDPEHPEVIPEGRIQMVKHHLEETLANSFGSFERMAPDGKRFNPAYVARFMSSNYALYRNIDDIVEASRTYIRDTMESRDENGTVLPPKIPDRFDPSDLRGDDFTTNSVRERLVVFNETKSRKMSEISRSEEPFLASMYDVIKSSLEANGCIVRPENIEIDENGVVRYVVDEVMHGALNYGVRASTEHINRYQAARMNGDDVEAPKLSATGKVCYTDRTPVPRELLGDLNYQEYQNEDGNWIYTKRVTGYIGRIIAPNQDGMVFDGKYYHAPGYSATIRSNRFGEDAPYEARFVLKGYEQTMAEAIRNRIRLDMLDGRAVTGDTTGIDNVLRHLYDVRYGADFYKRTAEDGLSPELRAAIIKTNTQRVKIDSSLMERANRVAIYSQVASAENFNPLVDNDMSPVTLTGGRNIAINESPGDGYVDPGATGNGGAQGVRYLANGAVVNMDGSITPAEVPYILDENGNLVKDMSKVPVCGVNEYFRSTGRMSEYDAVDRRNMTMNGVLHCMRETDRVGVAQISFGGWTLEDGLVVSKKFADKYMVPDKNRPGQYRPLTEGDKVECHGNKGVISIVIDPDMPDDEAAENGILQQVQWMRANPDMDVVMAPYSHVSRFNAGLGAEAMGLGEEAGVSPENVMKPGDLTTPDGEVLEGCLGHAKFTILEQTADVKTHFEEDGSPKRSYGAQAGWALAAADCPNILLDSFGDNSKSLIEMRELLITCGLDVSADGHLLVGYHPQEGESRNIIKIDKLAMNYKDDKPDNRIIKAAVTTDEFMDKISRCGGFVEIPFQLEFPRFDVSPDELTDIPGSEDGYLKSKVDRGNRATVGVLQEMPVGDEPTLGQEMFGKTYKLPVMSALLRSGQDFEDGKAIYHDWSNAYRNIYSNVVKYQAGLYKIMHPSVRNGTDYIKQATYAEGGKSDVDFAAWLKTLNPRDREAKLREQRQLFQECQRKAQAEFDRITSDIVSRKFESKHNIFRTGIMANKQANSATAIWTGDPRRKVDEVGMNPDMMKALGVKPGEYVMLHRDPVLRDGGMRYMKAVPDERLVGIAVNPAGIPKGMDGDFDGDTIGVHKLGSDAARREAMQHLSVYANLLDSQSPVESSWDESKHRYTKYKLFIAGGQDVAAGIAANPSLQAEYECIENMVNAFENEALEGVYDATYDANGNRDNSAPRELARKRVAAKNRIDEFLTKCYEAGVGRHVISYKSKEAHLQSVLDYTIDGAKGSAGKVATYAKNLGVDVQFNDDKTKVVSVTPIKNGIYSDDVRESNIGILQAKNMQTQYTGFGGMFSIRAVRALYNVDPKAALELTYVATQAVLQVKHDSEMADRYEQILSGPARWVWQGYKLEEVTNKAELKSVRPSGKYHKDARTGVVSERMDCVSEKIPKTWRIAVDDKGKPIKATRKDFVEQFLAVYGEGMDLKVNKQFVHRIADLLSEQYDPNVPVPTKPDELAAYRSRLDKSPVMNIEKEAVSRYGAPMQRLAYGAKMKDVYDLSNGNAGLFDVPTEKKFHKNYNVCMADANIMRVNQTAVRAGKAPVEIIAHQDVLAEGAQVSSRVLMGKKLVRAVSSKDYKRTAEHVEHKRMNPTQEASAPVEPSRVQNQQVQSDKRAKITPEVISKVRAGSVKVKGAFGVPESSKPAPQPPRPTVASTVSGHAPGTVFPDSSKTGLKGMDLRANPAQQPSQPARQPSQKFRVPEPPVREPDWEPERYVYTDADVPPEFLSQTPQTMYPHDREVHEAEEIARREREVHEADEIRRNSNPNDGSDNMSPK